VILLAVVTLVAVTPLGSQATHPVVLFLYRTLLFAITLLSVKEVLKKDQWLVSPIFIVLASLVMAGMWLSIVLNPGSYFEGMYRWYQHLLFGAAFIGLAALNKSQPFFWKQTILASIVVIDIVYLAVDLTIGRRPVIGPFVNPNYFASFLLAGFAASVAMAFFHSVRYVQIAGALSALFLYYGMTQAFSRGATVAAIVVAGIAALRIGKRYSVVAIAACMIVALVASPYLVQKFLDYGETDPYNYMRPQVWLLALKLVGENPIAGIGLDQFDDVSKQFAPAVEGQIGRYMKRPGIAHSEYLQYAAEIGLPAMLLLFGLAGYLVFLAMHRARTCGGESRVFQEAAILTASGLGLHALVDNNWNVPVMAAGLVVFSLADVLPRSDGKNGQLHKIRNLLAVPIAPLAVTAGVLIYAHSTIIPAAGLYFNEAGHRAYIAKDLNSAESLHRIAAAILPHCATCLDNAGIVYLDQHTDKRESHLLDFAETFFKRAMQAHTTAQEPRRHQEAVLISRLTGNVEKDREIHLKIIEIDRDILASDPFNPFVRKNLAEALYNVGLRADGETELQIAMEVEPNYVSAYLRMAEWLEESGRTAESETYRRRAASVVSKYESVAVRDPYEALLLGRREPNL
jgi:O-antigen ligase/Tfp pilus assembly protein PilF